MLDIGRADIIEAIRYAVHAAENAALKMLTPQGGSLLSARCNQDGGTRRLASREFEGSHRQYKHPAKKGRVTIAGHPSMDLDPKTKNIILKQAGLK
jgi:hypothetical protein